jgi:hypothetical protein
MLWYLVIVMIDIRRLLCLGVFLFGGVFAPAVMAADRGVTPHMFPSHQQRFIKSYGMSSTPWKSMADDENDDTKKDHMVAYPYGKSEFGMSSMVGFGKGEENTTVLFDLYYVIQPSDYIGLGVMTGFGFGSFSVLSASDQHQISTGYVPLSLMGRLNLRNHYLKSTVWYVYGMYGTRFQFSGMDDATVDGRASRRYAEWGLGLNHKKPASMYLIQKIQMQAHYTLGWQEISFSGEFGSTFNSVINYRLHMRYFTLRAIVAFTTLSNNRELNKKMQYGFPI